MRNTSFAQSAALVEKSYSGGRPTPPSSSQPQFQEVVPQGEPSSSCSLEGSWVLKSWRAPKEPLPNCWYICVRNEIQMVEPSAPKKPLSTTLEWPVWSGTRAAAKNSAAWPA